MKIDTLVIQPFGEMATMVMQFIPSFLTALVILITGAFVVSMIKKVTYEGLKAIKFDKVTYKIGITKALQTGGVKYGPCMLISTLIYAVLMVMVLIMTVKALGIPVGNEIIHKLTTFIPSVVTGVLILVIGMLIAKLVAGLVYIVARNTDMPSPGALSKITKLSILVYVTIIFLKEIGFVGLFTGAHYTIFLTGIVMALALAFGLAGRTVAGKYLDVLATKK